MNGVLPRITVVVPVYNAESTLPALLESLAAQDCAEPYEIVVSDDASSDASVAVARGFARDMSITILEPHVHRGAAAARNAGAACARSPILALCDADDVVHKGWLAALCAATRTHSLVSGAIHLLDAPETRLDPDALTAYYGHLRWSMTANLGIRRDCFTSVGGFSEQFTTAYDADLCWRLAARGLTLDYAPSAIVFKRSLSGLVPTFRQHLGYGLEHPLLFRRHRRLGMPRTTFAQAARRYAGTAATVARALRHPRSPTMRAAAARTGQDVGRLIGSLRWRALYL